MAAGEGVYPDRVFVERFSASPSAGNVAQLYPVPQDLNVLGMMLVVGTAPGGTSTVTVNISVFPTSQQGQVGSINPPPGSYNMWTSKNVPTITGTATNSFTTTNTTAFGPTNAPYALNYPLPGPSGTVGYTTAQTQAAGILTTETPTTAPPFTYKAQLTPITAPDNTYTSTDATGDSAAKAHSGDIWTFVIGGSIGSAANLEMLLVAIKR
jgi:hypothetical protein